MTQPNAQHAEAVQEPKPLLLANALLGTHHLNDAQLLSAQLRDAEVRRAETILRTTNLSALVHGGPLELKAHGLHEDEILRLMTLMEFALRAIIQRHRDSHSSHEDTAPEGQGGQMTQNIYPHSVPLNSVVDPASYLALALEGYSAEVEIPNGSEDSDSTMA